MNRIRAVMSSDDKANRSPVVIDNSGPVEDTLQQVEDQLNIELSRIVSPSRRRRANNTAFGQNSVQQFNGSAPSSISSTVHYTVPDMGFDRPASARKK